ncbi:mitotic-spindle organizing protein 2 [Thalassophryne amazonica]|uniref:mitotic-spindle organizing protein 2 n=1 Tax=Thalassophryne amazonica TaxID=390379 RepID=UPI001470FAF7|nr:mitotic-spindle organizing protein 2 [Thalassophryne amazonica]XP_034048046.1 mitotic-spindle organizing protein 2 [Thalassophryne amazonica]
MSQQPCPLPPDCPSVVVTANVQKFAMKKKKVLNTEENELYELTQAAGVTVDQEVFKIIVDLLKMNVAPQAVFQTLKSMCAGQRVAEGCAAETTVSSHPTNIPTVPAEVKVRSKAGASHSEKSKEAQSQRTQRQPSATRGQKTKSSGSSSSSSQINST